MEYFKIHHLLGQQRSEDAEAAVRGALAKDISNADLYILLARALEQQSKWAEAEKAVREALALAPDSEPAFYWLAAILLERGQRKAARKAIDSALAIDPDDPENYALKARILGEQSQPKKALEAVETGLQANPDNENCRFYRSIFLGQLGRHDEASDVALNLLGEDPEDDNYHSANGWVACERSDTIRAKMHFTEALRINPNSEDAKEGLVHATRLSNPVLGHLLRALGKLDKIPWVYLLIGAFLFGRYSRTLTSSELPFPVPQIAQIVVVLFISFILIALVTEPLSNLVMRFSRGAHWLLNEMRMKAIWFSTPPLIVGFLLLVNWSLIGSTSLPLIVAAWFSASRLFHEVFETEQASIRRWMWGFAVVGFLTACWITFAQYGIIRPLYLEATEAFHSLPDEGHAEAEVEYIEKLAQIFDLRSKLTFWPGMSVWLFAAFSDNVRDFISGKVS